MVLFAETLKKIPHYIEEIEEKKQIKFVQANYYDNDEKKSIQENSTIANTPLGQSLIQNIEGTRMLSIDEAGKKGKQRLERLQEELRDLSNRALDIEIETTEKYAQRVDLKEQDPNALLEFENQVNEVMKADDEHLFWTFDGEYWKDELGYYWYYIPSRCGR